MRAGFRIHVGLAAGVCLWANVPLTLFMAFIGPGLRIGAGLLPRGMSGVFPDFRSRRLGAAVHQLFRGTPFSRCSCFYFIYGLPQVLGLSGEY